MKGAKLQKRMIEADDLGVRGGVEKAFAPSLQRLASVEEAVSYAAQRGTIIVFEMEMGMVDRGCELKWISQYPREVEVLFDERDAVRALESLCVKAGAKGPPLFLKRQRAAILQTGTRVDCRQVDSC